MWKLNGSPKTVKVTRTLINEFHQLEPAPGDRFLSDRRAEKLKANVVGKTFRPVVWAKVHCKETGKWYRVNGKHTSQVMSELNGETKDLFAHVELYEAETLQDVAKLYATFDSRVSARTTGDINRSYSHAIPELAELESAAINVAIGGIAFTVWGPQYAGNSTPEQRAELLNANKGFVVWFAEMLASVSGRDRVIVKRVPVAAAMYQTWSKDAAASHEFWSLVRDGSGPKNTSPDRRLNKFLLTTSIGDVRRSGPNSSASTKREVYVKCLHAWNAWRRGSTSDLKFFPKADDPKVV